MESLADGGNRYKLTAKLSKLMGYVTVKLVRDVVGGMDASQGQALLAVYEAFDRLPAFPQRHLVSACPAEPHAGTIRLDSKSASLAFCCDGRI